MTSKLFSTVAASAIAIALPGSVLAPAPWPRNRSRPRARRAGPQDAAPTATPIKHLVIIFNENVSFDHYFATYPKAANPPGEPAFTAKPATPNVNNLANAGICCETIRISPTRPMAATPPNRSGSIAARLSPPIRTTPTPPNNRPMTAAKPTCFPNITGKASSGGAGAFGTKGQVMGYYDGNTVAAMWNYAQAFAMSDNAFGDTYGPSTPGMLNISSGPDQRHDHRRHDQKAVHGRRRFLLHR